MLTPFFLLIADVNVKVTRSGLQTDRGDAASHNSSSSSRSFSSTRPDCLERMEKRPSGTAAASSRWQDDGRTLDPVAPSSRYRSKNPVQESGVALRSLPRELGLSMPDNGRAQEGATDVSNVWPQSRSKRPVKWLFQEAPVQSNFLLALSKFQPHTDAEIITIISYPNGSLQIITGIVLMWSKARTG